MQGSSQEINKRDRYLMKLCSWKWTSEVIAPITCSNRDLGKKTMKEHKATKDKENKRITRTNEVLKIWENDFKIHLNTQCLRQEKAHYSIPDASSNVEAEQLI